MKKHLMALVATWSQSISASTGNIVGGSSCRPVPKSSLLLLVALCYAVVGWATSTEAQINSTYQTYLNEVASSNTFTFSHQVALNTSNDIAYIQQQINAKAEPWYSAYSKMATSAFATTNYAPNAFATTTLVTNGGQVWGGINDNPDYGCIPLNADAQAAYTQALMWEITQQPVYAQNAIKIMNAWSANLKSFGGANWYLEDAWVGSIFPLAAEIIRNTYAYNATTNPNGWTSAGIAQFSNMLNTAFLPELNERYGYGNREFACCNALCAIGVFNNDNAAFYQGLRHWMSYFPCYVYMSGDNGYGANTPNVPNYWVTTGGSPPLAEPTLNEYCNMDAKLFPHPTSSNCWILSTNSYPTEDINPPAYPNEGGPYGDDKTSMVDVYNDPSEYLASTWWVGSNPKSTNSWETLPYFQGQTAETVSRDLGHVENSICEVFAVAEMARVQGFDLYTTSDLRLQAFLEENAYLRLGNTPPDGLTAADISQVNLTPTYEVGYNHLVNVLGLDLPYSEQLIDPVLRWAQWFYIPYGSEDYFDQVLPAPNGITAPGLGGETTLAGGWETLTHGDLNGDNPGQDSDLALGQSAIASSTAGTDGASTYFASNAVDGNLGTRWSSTYNNTMPQTLAVDLGNTYNITGVTLNWASSYATAYSIQTSSNSNGPWTTIYSTTTSAGGYQQLTGLSGVGEYVQLLCTTPLNKYDYSLWEFQVYGTLDIPTAGLVADYQFDDNTDDSSGLGNNGTGTNSFIYSTTNTAAGAPYSGQFNGTGARVDVPNSTSLEITGNLTLACWAYLNNLSSDQDLIAKSYNSAYRLIVTTSGELELALANGSGGGNLVYSTQKVPAGAWTHIAATVSISGSTATVQFYINGVADPTAHMTTMSSINAGTGILVLGCSEDGDNQPLNGNLDEVLIYNVALTSAQIAQLAQP